MLEYENPGDVEDGLRRSLNFWNLLHSGRKDNRKERKGRKGRKDNRKGRKGRKERKDNRKELGAD
ncbi:MAG: hypothetical protein GX946_11200 [Oligosphaeraceae bacterium]|nr:hypothetical protein [Oligosphaeraceae bacterium]